jgi:hypothetical protein
MTNFKGVVFVTRCKMVRSGLQESCDSIVRRLSSALLVVSVLHRAQSVAKTTFEITD